MNWDASETVGVIGGGSAGRRLAVELLRAGYRVYLYNSRAETSAAAVAAVRAALAGSDGAALAARLVPSLDVVQAGGNAEFVLEAVADDLELKREIYRRIEEVADVDALIMSVSRAFTVLQLVPLLDRAERFLLARPDFAARRVQLLPGAGTSPAALAAAAALWRRLGWTPGD